MIAVIQTGGKQYQVQKGDKLTVEKLSQAEGKSVEFSEVLLISDGKNITVGKPTIAKAKVVGKLIKTVKAPKIIVFKYKPTDNVRKKKGHRQNLSEVLIEDIVTG